MRTCFAGLGLLALGLAAFVPRAALASPSEGASAEAIDWTPTPDEQTVYRMLSLRDGGPDCATVEASVKDPVPVLASVAEHATLPPAVGVRAAHCLTTRHAEEAKATLLAWVVDPEKRGFAILIADDLSAMPEAVALEIARAGLAGPHAATLNRRVGRSTWASVAALATVPPAQ